jgi:hypothetical protein
MQVCVAAHMGAETIERAHRGGNAQPYWADRAQQGTCGQTGGRAAAAHGINWLRMHAAALHMRAAGLGASQKHVGLHAWACFACHGLHMCFCGLHGLGIGLGLGMGL